MIADIFEVEPPIATSEFEGVDLLYGFSGDPGQKALAFFEGLARTRGVDCQQAYARLASGPRFPYIVDDYAERLVLQLHERLHDRSSPAWLAAQEEIKHCLDYLNILSENLVLPALFRDEGAWGGETFHWDMAHLGKHHTTAGIVLLDVERYLAFCADPEALGDELQLRLDLLRAGNESKFQ